MPDITIVVTVSRQECMDLVKANLEHLDLAGHECDLVIMLDNDNISLLDWNVSGEKYPNKIVKQAEIGGPKPSAGNVPQLRSRIAHVRNQSRELVGKTDFVLSFEDDCVVPTDALVRLLKDWETLSHKENIGFISGIQVGRHGRRVLGAWYADNYQFPNECTTLGKRDVATPLVEVDGAGFYCYLTPTKLYKSATYGWHEPVGPDAWWGFWLRTKGYVNYVDQSLVIGHKVAEKILKPDNDVVKAKFFIHRGQWQNKIVRENA